MKFSGQTALVTGVGQGIGRATALELAQNGANLVLIDFNEEKLEQTKRDVQALGVQASSYVCDVADESRVKEICEEVLAIYGKVDILVNNAGLFREFWGPFLESDSTAWNRAINVNILGAMYFSYNLLPKMLEQGYGRIVNLGSVAGDYGLANFVSYSMTKGAINGFTMALAKETTGKGVTVNAVLPGMVRGNPEQDDGYTKVNAIKRKGEPEEFAKLIVFLASPDAGYISGQNIRADGCRIIM